METFIILLVFLGGPLALFAFIIFAAIQRARAKRTIEAAAAKYLNS